MNGILREKALLPPRTRLRVAVLCGGPSAEREISLRSGECVAVALTERGHEIRRIDPVEVPLDRVDWSEFDVAFIALHGTYGEDGQVQRELDRLGMPYTGSGERASAAAFDKLKAKAAFVSRGLRTPPWREIGGDGRESPERAAESLGFPLVVKPVAQGSSLGVSIVRSPDELPAGMRQARQFGEHFFLEAAIAGEEWTVPVLDDGALPPIRIHTEHPFFDFTAKYVADDTRYEVRDHTTDAHAGRIASLALRAAASLDCRGIGRVDLRVDGTGTPWLLEVNTIPGMTDHSLVPKSAASLGWSLGELCERTIASVWERSRHHEKRRRA